MNLTGGQAVVLGIGSFGGGAGAARHLCRRGWRVVATDLRDAESLGESLAGLEESGVELVLGQHRPEDFEAADLVVVNPAIRPTHPLLRRARQRGARLTSEVELFLEACPARITVVTGTHGKSSTVHWTATLLQACGRGAHAGGNLGGSLLDRLETLEPDDRVVVELSSYQLEALRRPARLARRGQVDCACITAVDVDHLERHRSAKAYLAAKLRILELLAPAGRALLPGDDPRSRTWSSTGRASFFAEEPGPGIDLDLGGGWFRLFGRRIAPVEALRMPGDFQRRNALCALGLASWAGAPEELLARALEGLTGLPHRLEDLGTFQGRRVVDNGVSTTPATTAAALRALAPGTCVLIGGKPKSLPFDPLPTVLLERQAYPIVFGAARPVLEPLLGANGIAAGWADDLAEAVRKAFESTSRGGTILFSPACASYDAYPNFERRAQHFRALLPPRDR